MTAITRFEDIQAWQTARQLASMIYAMGNQTGFNRDFGYEIKFAARLFPC
ncbi:MAG: hypothetical protein ACXW4Q_16210 [Anaerolineales bacterium]